MGIKLYYFDLPGRGEVPRLLLTGGNVEFEDIRVKDWMAFKPKTPFGQLPVMEVDGAMLAQSKAIDVYCAKLAGFYPEDPWVAAQADMVIGQLEDVWQLFMATFGADDAVKKRGELIEGAVKAKLTPLDKLLDGKEFVAGDKLSHGDISLLVVLCGLMSSWMEGVPTTMLDPYPNIKRIRNNVANVDFVKKYYENEHQGPRAIFKPDA